jgi:uncharacterized damage-inducible protein DinB
MNALDVVRRLHQHRMWANHRLVEAAEKLQPVSLARQLAIGQGSIWRSLVHLYAAEWVWLEALLGNEFPVLPGDRPDKLPGNQQGQGGPGSLAELKTAWQDIDRRWNDYLAARNDSDLDRIVYKVGSLSGIRQAARQLDVLLHICTHAHYTTAQVINMLRQVGVESLPDPMLITMARQELAAG